MEYLGFADAVLLVQQIIIGVEVSKGNELKKKSFLIHVLKGILKFLN